MKKVLTGLAIVAALVVALAAVAWFKFCPRPGADEALTFPVDSEYVGWVGKPADLDFVSLDGRKVTSAELRGKVVLIDFWATWCGPCMQSLDHLKSTHAKFNGQGLEVVAINFDEDRAALESVVKSKGLPWPQYFEGRDNSIGASSASVITRARGSWTRRGTSATSVRWLKLRRRSARCWPRRRRRRPRWARTRTPVIAGVSTQALPPSAN